MTHTLFIGENILLLEGPSDLIYLDVSARPPAAPAWTLDGVKTPIGGSGKLSTFASLLAPRRTPGCEAAPR